MTPADSERHKEHDGARGVVNGSTIDGVCSSLNDEHDGGFKTTIRIRTASGSWLEDGVRGGNFGSNCGSEPVLLHSHHLVDLTGQAKNAPRGNNDASVSSCRSSVRWLPPQRNWIKINSDGAQCKYNSLADAMGLHGMIVASGDLGSSNLLVFARNGLDSILDNLIQENGNAVGLDSLAVDVKENFVGLIDIVKGLLDDGVNEKKEDHIGVVVPGPDERVEVRVDSGSDDDVIVENDKNEGSKEDHCLGINGVGSVKRIQEDCTGVIVPGPYERLEVRLDSGRYKRILIGVVVAGSEERLEVRVDSGSGDNVVVENDKNEGSKEDHCSGINGVDSVKGIREDHIGVIVVGSDERLGVRVDSGSEGDVDVEHAKNEGSMEDHYLMMEDHVGVVAVGSDERLEVRMDDGSVDNAVVVTFKDERTKEDDRSGINGVDLVKRIQVSCSLPVGYFGSRHVAWCRPSQLKPFRLNFDRMIEENKDRSFLSAVEKAMDDFEKHLKLGMTCPCVLKENKFVSSNSATNEGASMAECKSSPLGVFSTFQFEPQKFLYQIKDLAQVVSKPGMLEFIVLQNYLSAFYHSMGYCQLLMHRIWGPTYDADSAGCSSIGGKDANTGLAEEIASRLSFFWEQSDVRKNEMSELKQNGVLAKISDENGGSFLENCSSKWALTSRKRKRKIYFEVMNNSAQFEGLDRSFQLRERKKSKYLLYPYVNRENKGVNETEDPITPKFPHEGVNEFIGSPSAVKRSAKRFQKSWHMKFIRGSDVTDYPELDYTSSAELLSKLHLIAIDRPFTTECKNFDLMEWFFSRFTISAYHDESIYEMHCHSMANQKEATAINLSLPATALKPTSSRLTGHKMRKKKKLPSSGTFNTISLSSMSDVNTNFADQQTRVASNLPDLMGKVLNPSHRLKMYNKACQKKRGRKPKVPSGHPNQEANIVSLEVKSVRKRRRRKNGEESELQMSKESSSARVIFMRSEDAAKALRSLEESNPFGATLTKYDLQNDTNLMEGFRLPARLTGPVPHLADAPPIDFIRRNLETMTQMLEK
ncbi:hypothetical protein F3Y22_tig00117026pilonHSYRG00203 [Hibiscus syriacus]|uniref:Peptidase A2 domain-containing protein n=1 Tax=Hibiscus syriacus TaxID=106335 RepID=A0A6A2XB37_HIBSY|nr:hypothetical protein F3Y22_tig00117026pilonHSYRG00203 [Hibiscus syriacus]